MVWSERSICQYTWKSTILLYTYVFIKHALITGEHEQFHGSLTVSDGRWAFLHGWQPRSELYYCNISFLMFQHLACIPVRSHALFSMQAVSGNHFCVTIFSFVSNLAHKQSGCCFAEDNFMFMSLWDRKRTQWATWRLIRTKRDSFWVGRLKWSHCWSQMVSFWVALRKLLPMNGLKSSGLKKTNLVSIGLILSGLPESSAPKG